MSHNGFYFSLLLILPVFVLPPLLSSSRSLWLCLCVIKTGQIHGPAGLLIKTDLSAQRRMWSHSLISKSMAKAAFGSAEGPGASTPTLESAFSRRDNSERGENASCPWTAGRTWCHGEVLQRCHLESGTVGF